MNYVNEDSAKRGVKRFQPNMDLCPQKIGDENGDGKKQRNEGSGMEVFQENAFWT